MDEKTRLRRFLEIVPGFFSWSLILFPVWGSLVIPQLVAYYILAFDVYWLYKSVSLGVLATLSFFRIKANQKYNWMKDVQGFGDWEKVQHIIIIPNYKEPLYILQRTLTALKNQTFPTKNLHVILAFEEREGETAQEKYETLKEEFGECFCDLIPSYHPVLPNEVVGKSSNMAWAAQVAKKRNY